MSETKGWPTFKVTIPEYGWDVVFYEPSVAEVKEMRRHRDDGDETKMWETFAKLIKCWDATDRNGAPLPLNSASFELIPPSVIKAITEGLVSPKSADPKGEASTSVS